MPFASRRIQAQFYKQQRIIAWELWPGGNGLKKVREKNPRKWI